MNLDNIPAGSLCVVDTNVLLYAEQGASSQAQRFVKRCASGEVTATLPQTVWQEFTHKLMLAEAMARGLTSGGNPASRLGSRPEAIKGLTLYKSKVRALVDLGFGFEPCLLPDLLDRAFALQERHGLLTNDSMVLAVALRLKADALVSSDKAFHGIAGLGIYRPTDLRM